jgi:hypothetical protein
MEALACLITPISQIFLKVSLGINFIQSKFGFDTSKKSLKKTIGNDKEAVS